MKNISSGVPPNPSTFVFAFPRDGRTRSLLTRRINQITLDLSLVANRLAAVRMAAMRSATTTFATRTEIRAFCIDKCVVCMPQGDIDPSDGQSSSSVCCRHSDHALSTSFEQSIQYCCFP
jgi:hypothetical protein